MGHECVFGYRSFISDSTTLSSSHAFRNQPRLCPILVSVCILTASSVRAQVHNSLAAVLAGVHPPSLLITNVPPPAGRFLYRLPAPPHLCHRPPPSTSKPPLASSPFSFFYLVQAHSRLFLCGRAHKTGRLLSGQRGAEEGCREMERKTQKEEGGRELSNRIKGEQRNGKHLKYSWHEPSRKKEGMSNNGWIIFEALCRYTHMPLSPSSSLSVLPPKPLLLPPSIFPFWPHFRLLSMGFDWSRRSCVLCFCVRERERERL